MPEPLKNVYSPAYINRLGEELKKAYPKLDPNAFVKSVIDRNWEQLELKQRMHHIVHCIHRHLPVSYAKQVEIIQKAAPNFAGFGGLLFPDFIEEYGIDDPDVSIPALEYLTRFSSSEFAVRPFIIKYEKRMLKQHLAWAKHKDHHVRRLASEGIRPRLPWAMALPAFKKDPAPVLPILELLKNDESEYVRRSVANNLNDISKDHPGQVLKVIGEWRGISPETDRLVKHACRGLLKKGHTEALQSFGLNHKVKATVSDLKLNPSKLSIGDAMQFSFKVDLHEKKTHEIRVEYKIYFVKANGSLSSKIFQIGTYETEPGASFEISRQHKFSDLTTRKHYPGEHKLCIVINGKEMAEAAFLLKQK